MRFQFSLSTLLVSITVLAAVCGAAVALRVDQTFYFPDTEGPVVIEYPNGPGLYFPQPMGTVEKVYSRPPTASEIGWRLVLWGPPAVAAMLGVLWLLRRVRSRGLEDMRNISAATEQHQ